MSLSCPIPKPDQRSEIVCKQKAANEMTTRNRFPEVLRVASDVATGCDSDIPKTLLRLKSLFEAQTLRAAELRDVREDIWKCDLVHVLVEVLRQDFSRVPGAWITAAELASLLSGICSGLKPAQKASRAPAAAASTGAGQSSVGGATATEASLEQIEEYYDFLLPTAVDSLLILANNILELESIDSDSLGTSTSANYLECYCMAVDSLVWLCKNHPSCVLRAVKSPYLLNALISDSTDYCEVAVLALKSMVEIDSSQLAMLPTEALQAILDELAYKALGGENNLAIVSIQVLARFAKGIPSMLDYITTRYKGLLAVIRKWKDQQLDGEVEEFISQLERMCDSQEKQDHAGKAALLIQSAWRGYATRKQLERVQRGIRRFQLIYRKRRAERMEQKRQELAVKRSEESHQATLRDSLCSFHKQQMTIVEQLPASELEGFMHCQQHQAATTIQAWWKGTQARRDFEKKSEAAKVVTKVVVLQRAVRRFLRKRRWHRDYETNRLSTCSITQEEREALQLEIARQRELHPPAYHSEAQLQALHDEVQDRLGEFYSSRLAASRLEEQQSSLIAQLDRDCARILSAPALSEATPDVVKVFSSDSVVIARMARMAHEEELKAMQLPWWKRFNFDQDITL